MLLKPGYTAKPTFVSLGRVCHFNAEAPVRFFAAIALRLKPNLEHTEHN